MSNLFVKLIRLLFIVAILVICCNEIVTAQVNGSPAGDVSVPILQNYNGKNFRCNNLKNSVVDAEAFKKVTAQKDCADLNKQLNVNFENQTLIAFRVQGDCFVSASASVTRNDGAKKYKVHVRKMGGGCRAGGSFQGWLVIEKIASDYAVEFIETWTHKFETKAR